MQTCIRHMLLLSLLLDTFWLFCFIFVLFCVTTPLLIFVIEMRITINISKQNFKIWTSFKPMNLNDLHTCLVYKKFRGWFLVQIKIFLLKYLLPAPLMSTVCKKCISSSLLKVILFYFSLPLSSWRCVNLLMSFGGKRPHFGHRLLAQP